VSILSEEIKTHDRYCRLLRRIGNALGYKTEIRQDRRYHLANPDCVWFVSLDPRIGLAEADNVPLITFEVLYTEREKAIRGSLKSLEIYDSPIGILVLIREGLEKMRKNNETSEQTVRRFKDYAKRLIDAQGLKRYYLWDETNVDRLAKKLGVSS